MERCSDCGKVTDDIYNGLCSRCYDEWKYSVDKDDEQHEDEW
jgi:NMD protein affecting ribosome stability and mRNA decay